VKAKGDLQVQSPPRSVQERDEDLESKLKASAKEKQEGVQSGDEEEEKEGDDEESDDGEEGGEEEK